MDVKSSRSGKTSAPHEDALLIGERVPEVKERPSADRGPSPRERRAILSFAGRVLVFCAPLIVLAGGIEILLWRIGETWPIERVIKVQQTDPRAIFSRLILDQGTFRYKYLQAVRLRPQILVLGSSRVMQFRHEMFGRGAASFYNAGGMIHSVADINSFLDRFPKEMPPQIIILGIDFWWLNPNTKMAPNDSFAAGVDEDGTYSWQGHFTVLSSYVRSPSSLIRLIKHGLHKDDHKREIGLQAALDHRGFRADGSKQFELKVPNTPEGWRRRLPKSETARKDVLGGGPRFAFSDGISPALLDQLRVALLRLKEQHVFVIGYNPPVVSEWARLAASAPHSAEFWKQYHESVPALFRSLNIPFFDVLTPAQVGFDDRYMRDPYHPYETLDMRMLQLFCENREILALLPDVPRIAEQTLASAKTNPLHLDLSMIDPGTN